MPGGTPATNVGDRSASRSIGGSPWDTRAKARVLRPHSQRRLRTRPADRDARERAHVTSTAVAAVTRPGTRRARGLSAHGIRSNASKPASTSPPPTWCTVQPGRAIVRISRAIELLAGVWDARSRRGGHGHDVDREVQPSTTTLIRSSKNHDSVSPTRLLVRAAHSPEQSFPDVTDDASDRLPSRAQRDRRVRDSLPVTKCPPRACIPAGEPAPLRG